MSTCRERRLYPQTYKVDPSKLTDYSNNLKYEDGELDYGSSHKVKSMVADGPKLTIDFTHAYADDVLALSVNMLTDWFNATGGTDKYMKAAIEKAQEAVYLMDRRAVTRHGFSGNEEERNVQVPYDPQAIDSIVENK